MMNCYFIFIQQTYPGKCVVHKVSSDDKTIVSCLPVKLFSLSIEEAQINCCTWPTASDNSLPGLLSISEPYR